MNADVGDTVTLSCQVSGYPNPTVAWYKNGLPVTSSGISSAGLTLENVAVSDSGHYMCKATNILGSKSKVFTLTVGGGKPSYKGW